MRVWLCCALAAALSVPALAPVRAQAPQVPAQVTDLPLTVVLVRVVGPWIAGNQRGISRIIAVADGTRMRLFVQWIADGATNAEIASTVEVPEVGRDRLVFGDVRVEVVENASTVFLDTLAGANGLKDTYSLSVQTPGQFRFRRAS